MTKRSRVGIIMLLVVVIFMMGYNNNKPLDVEQTASYQYLSFSSPNFGE